MTNLPNYFGSQTYRISKNCLHPVPYPSSFKHVQYYTAKDSTLIYMMFHLGPVRYLLNLFGGDTEHYIYSFYADFRNSVTNMCAIPFVYRYLLVCHSKALSAIQTVLLYFVFMVPVFICMPLRAHLMTKYSPYQREMVANDTDVDCSVPFVVGYKPMHITESVSSGSEILAVLQKWVLPGFDFKNSFGTLVEKCVKESFYVLGQISVIM
jgi:hypothetical protein